MTSSSAYSWSRRLCDTSYARLFYGVRTADQAPVVIKTARDEYPSPEDLAKLRHEHALLSSLELPGVPRTYGLLETEGGVGLVLEHIEGRSLASLLAEARPSVEHFLTLAVALTEVVASIHQRGVLHKDLKSEHFFIDAQGKVTLIDFGLATRLSREARARHGVTTFEGTFAYMSPEQTGKMNRAIDQRSDLYSLGVTLYELLTGSLPFTSSDPLELVHSHLARSPAAPELLRPELPPVISAIVLKLLAKAAEDRYQDAGGLIADLQRCLTQLRAHPEQSLESFALGAEDAAGVLRIPQKLYGREAETATLLAAFERCAAGAAELLLVAGPSGVGKSVLVQELQKLLVRRGRIAAGKFDQLNRAVPYEPIAQACRELLTSILAESAERLDAWAERLRSALGANAGVIVDLVPELELIVGKQPPPLALDPSAAQRRFEQAFQGFVRFFTSREHSLVLFLDDLQWADPASLRLLHVLLTAPDRGHLLVVGGYRDNEVGPAHALTLALSALEQAGATIHTLAPQPLGFTDVRALIADALGYAQEAPARALGAAQPRADALAELAALSLRKTGGNPFFLGQFLTTLAERALLGYDQRAHAWQWDLAQIEQLGVTDNVLDLLVERLHRLAPRTRDVLQTAACIGNRFELDTLATVLSRSQSEVAEDLWAPLREGLIAPLDERYRYLALEPGADSPRFRVGYEFQHDRVQQAAYSLIEPEQRAGAHLQIGRLLRQKYAQSVPDEQLFELVNHLNLGAVLMTDADERRELASLDLRAGVRARDAAAYAVAIHLLTKCRELLGDMIWADGYPLGFAAHFAQIECEAASGNMAAAFALIELLCRRAPTDLDRAAVRRLEAAVLTQVSRMGDAIAAGVEAARLLGTELPLEPSALGAAVQAEFGAVQQALGGREIASLLDLPVMSEPRALVLAQILTTMVPSSFQTNPQLFALVLLKAVSLSLAAGNPPAAPHFYASYALLHGIITGDHASAYRFGRLGVALGERPHHRGSAGAAALVFASFVAHWQSHVSESLAHYQRGLRASLEVGDHLSFGYCATHGCFMRLFADADLTALQAEVHGFKAPLRNASDHINTSLLRTVTRAIETLRGRRWNDTSLDRKGLHEAADLEAMQVNPTLLGMHLIVKTMALYFAGDLAGAQEASDSAEPICGYQRGMLWSVEHRFYRALVRAALHRAQPPEQREALAATLEKDEQALRELAAGAPLNHGHKLALIAAERAALRGDAGQALAHFDQALAHAREHGFAQHEALINERYALFHLDQGRVKVARLYLLEAHHGYTRWGAITKSQQLAANHPELFAVAAEASARASLPALHITGAMGGLDLATAVRVTQAITSELMLDKLIERLMRSLVESAGAQRGFLIVPEEQRLRIAAQVTVEPDQVRLHLDQDLDTSGELATAVVQFVARSREPVVLADAPTDRRFGRDSYIARARPKSILAVAMVHHGRLRGVLYLENNAAKAAFDPARTELLQFLAAQAATAIENATLYEELEQRVAERTAALAATNERLQASLKELGAAQRSLIDMSRQAGMADVATSILHNVGNVLNSVNVSASVVISAVQHSKAAGIGKLAKLLEEHRAELGRFLTEDARGSRIPSYLTQLSQAVELEQSGMTHELGVLRKNLEHINAIVTMQQAHAKGAGIAEDVLPRELLEDAIKLGAGSIGGGDAELISVCDDLPPLSADRHKILQILMNLLSNARDAVRGAADRRIVLRCRKLDERFAISVEDHGVGVPEVDLTRIFNFGFTTKKDGHGFGLHASALAAAELGGTLTCRSEGPGKGATFTLELPYRASRSRMAS